MSLKNLGSTHDAQVERYSSPVLNELAMALWKSLTPIQFDKFFQQVRGRKRERLTDSEQATLDDFMKRLIECD